MDSFDKTLMWLAAMLFAIVVLLTELSPKPRFRCVELADGAQKCHDNEAVCYIVGGLISCVKQ